MDQLQFVADLMVDGVREDLAPALAHLRDDEDYGFLAEPITDLLDEECAVCTGPIYELFEASRWLYRIAGGDTCCHDAYAALRETADGVMGMSPEHVFVCRACLPVE